MLLFESYEKTIQMFISFFTNELNKFHQRKCFVVIMTKKLKEINKDLRF